MWASSGLLLATALSTCHSFVIPDLSDLGPRLFSNQLKFRVAVGDKKTPFQMKDLHVELSGDGAAPLDKSTGYHDAKVLKKPFFIDSKGEQFVELENGKWEVQWAKGSPHGLLVCSFLSPKEAQRTDDAKLEAGRFFMYHRVWTTETLASERERRLEIQAEAAIYLNDRDQKVKVITDEETNVGSKVINYAKAAKSMSDYRNSGYKESLFIPLYDTQVLPLTPDCIVSSRGMIYKAVGKKPEYIGESRVDFLQKVE